jgi:hypothetical protein
MNERINECKAAGCEAECCKQVYFEDPLTVEEMAQYFPKAREVSYEAFADYTYPGVYYYQIKGYCFMRIVGTCPNLENNDCLIYKTGRPKPCEQMRMDSKICVSIRKMAKNNR